MSGWNDLGLGECGYCGVPSEIKTTCDVEGMAYDGDEARCSRCHFPGSVFVDEGRAWVEWVEDGYEAEAAERIGSYEKLYLAVNEMMAILGANGEINTRQNCVNDVMGALHDIDGGVYQRETE